MPTMCAIVAQGWLPQALETTVNETSDYDALLKQVANPKRTFTEMLVDIGVIAADDKKTITHLNRHWLGNDRHGWWPQYANKGEVLRQGLIRLIESARDSRLPVGIYWVCSGPHFQCIVAESSVQSTLMVLTPPIPAATDQPASTVAENMWVVGGKSQIDAVVLQASLYGGRPTEKDCRELDSYHDIWETQVFSEAK